MHQNFADPFQLYYDDNHHHHRDLQREPPPIPPPDLNGGFFNEPPQGYGSGPIFNEPPQGYGSGRPDNARLPPPPEYLNNGQGYLPQSNPLPPINDNVQLPPPNFQNFPDNNNFGQLPDQPDFFAGAYGGGTGVRKVSDVGVEAVETAFMFNLLLFIVLMGLYEVASRSIPTLYAARRGKGGNAAGSQHDAGLPLSWVPRVANASWTQVCKTGGVDAYMYLRYLRLCLHIVAVSGFWGMLVLFPIFATGGGHAVGWYHLSMSNIVQGSWRLWFPAVYMWYLTFYVLFLMNEEYKHFVEVRRDYLAKEEQNVDPQHQYTIMIENIPNELRSDKALYDYFNALFPEKVHSATMVMNIPDLEDAAKRRARVVRRLEKSMAIFESTGERPTHVVGAKRCRCLGIESLPIFSSGGPDAAGRHDYEGDAVPQKGERVDSITYYRRELAEMNEKVSRMQTEKKQLANTGNEMTRASEWIAIAFEGGFGSTRQMSSSLSMRSKPSSVDDGIIANLREPGGGIVPVIKAGFSFFFGGFLIFDRHLDIVVESVVGNAMSSTGFVTFKDRFSTTCARSAPLCPRADVLSVQMAPEPRDIVWDNAYISSMMITGREATANVLLVLGVLLWSVPVAFIQAVATVESIATIPGMEWVAKFSGGQSTNFINGYLPVVAMLGLINLLPVIFEWIATVYEDRKTHSDVQNSILGRFFYYQLANIYIIVTAGSVWDSLADIINHPSAALWILGKSLPMVVGYFISLLVTKILAGLPIILLRIGELFRRLIIKCFFRESEMSPRELNELYRRQMLWYGWEYPSQLLVIVICFTYACISPIILPVGAFYFFLALLVYKKQVLDVYNPIFESGGKMFPSVCSRTLVGLICGQVTLAGYILIRQGFTPVLILLPLPFFTFRMIHVFDKMYVKPSDGLTLEMAMELDTAARTAAGTSTPKFVNDVYRQPVLAEPISEAHLHRGDTFSDRGFADMDGVELGGSVSEGNDKASSVGKIV